MIRRAIILGALCGLVVSIGLVSTGWTQTENYDVEVTWTKPTVGTAPVLYHVWVRSKVDGAEVFDRWTEWETTPELIQILTFQRGRCYEVKINAEDNSGLIGPDSNPSVEYCSVELSDPGTGPAQPGKPTFE